MKSQLTLLLCLCFSSLASGQACMLFPVSLQEKVNHSALIVEGKIIGLSPSWNASQTMIYTAVDIEVYCVKKGSTNSTQIRIYVEGGQVGSSSVEVHPSPKVEIGQIGMFFLNPIVNPVMTMSPIVYGFPAGPQSVYEYIQSSNAVDCPFDNHFNIQNFGTLVSLFTAQNQVIQTGLINNSPGGSLFLPPPMISSFSPTNLSAGTSSILTINGNSFGAATGTISFPSANAGGGWVNALPSQIVSWTNTQIQVRVPSAAGTGQFRVTDAGGLSGLSGTALFIPFNHLNSIAGGIANMQRHPATNGAGGTAWRYSTAFSTNLPAVAAFERALETWRCATFINWPIGPATSITNQALDGVNVVNFGNLPIGVLGVCYSYPGACSPLGGGSPEYTSAEQDVIFASSLPAGTTWGMGPALPTSTQFDLETVALHELGHAHLLGHVINTAAPMHASVAPAVSNRALLPVSEIVGGNWVMARSSVFAGCGMPQMTLLTSLNCAVNSPVAAFGASPLFVCTGAAVTFTDQSTGNPTSWNWSFPGGTPATSILANPTITYNTPGVYSVSLTVNNAAGAGSTTQNNLITVGPPSAIINGTSTIYAGNSANLRFDFTGTQPWSVTYTDGVTPVVLTGITANPHYVMVSPASTTNYTIVSFSDAQCAGIANGNALVTVLPMPALLPGLGLPVWPLSNIGTTNFSTYDWTSPTSQVGSIPFNMTSQLAQEGVAMNQCGEVEFYLIHTGANASNNLFPVSTNGTLLSNQGMNSGWISDEIQVIQVPGFSTEWFIVYSLYLSNFYLPSRVLFSRVRYDCGNFQYLVKDSVLQTSGLIQTYSLGKALARNVPTNPNYFYLYLGRKVQGPNLVSLDRFLVSETGITWNGNTGNVIAYNWPASGGYGEIEVTNDGNRISLIVANETSGNIDLVFWDANLFSNTPGAFETIQLNNLILQPDGLLVLTPGSISSIATSNPQLQFLQNFDRKNYWGEFSASGRYFYLGTGGHAINSQTHLSYLAQIDLFSPLPHDVRLQIQSPSYGIFNSITGAGCSYTSAGSPCWMDFRRIIMMEKSFDGRIYFTKNHCDTMFVIPNPDQPMPQMLVPGEVNLSIAGIPNIPFPNIILSPPDQIDGYSYASSRYNTVDLSVSVLGCQGCAANSISPFSVNLFTSSGIHYRCLSIANCPDTSRVCISIDSVYYLEYNGIRIDSAIVNGVVSRNLFEFIINYTPFVHIDPVPTRCDTVSALTLIGFPAGGTFSGTGVTGNQFSPAIAGAGQHWIYYQYTDTVSLCSARDSVLATVLNQCCFIGPINLVLSIDSVRCFSGNDGAIQVAATGGVSPPYQYSLDGITYNASGIFPNLYAGTYTLHLRNSIIGCDTTISVSIYQPTPIAMNPTLTHVACNVFNNGSIQLSPAGGTGTILVSFNGGSFGSAYTFSGLSAGSYNLVAQDSLGCQISQTVILQQLVLQGLIDSVFHVSCNSLANGRAYFNASGGTPIYQYSINGGSFQASGTFNLLSPGPYQVIVTDQNLCRDTVQVSIIEPAILNLALQTITDVLCFGYANGTVTLAASGGTTPYLFSVNGSAPVSNPTINGLSAGNHTVQLTDANGCIANIFFTINSPPELILILNDMSPSTCPGKADGSLSYTASGGVGGYTFSINGGPAQNNGIFTSLVFGSYTITLRDSNLCEVSAQANVDQLPAPIATIDVSRDPCLFPFDVSFSAQNANALTSSWSFGDGATASGPTATHSFLSQGNYIVTLTVTDSLNCTDTAMQSLALFALPTADFSSNPLFPISIAIRDAEFDFQNQSQNATRYLWSFGDGATSQAIHPHHMFETKGKYCIKLNAYNINECADSIEKCGIEIFGGNIFFPNAFSPNGDGLNDVFYIVSNMTFSDFNFQIFDRWGKLVFEADSPEKGWDGTFQGQTLPEGVFTYKLNAQTITGDKISRPGTVMLIR